MSLIQANTNSEAEASSVAANGFKSSPNIDYSFLDWEVISEMAAELQKKCDEYGGAYPRGNWRLGSTNSHLNSLVQHYSAYQAGINDPTEHLLHIAIRAMFAYSVHINGLKENQNGNHPQQPASHSGTGNGYSTGYL